MMKLRKRVKKLLGEVYYRFWPGRAKQAVEIDIPAFHELGPEDIAIDCGANRGLVTRVMAANGARVHAFEPNPVAYERLIEATRGMPSVTCYNKAVLDRPGRMQLYLHLNFDRNPERFSERSSLYAEKVNVDESRAVDVEVVDLVEFIMGLDRPVKLLKIDIEGAEYELLEGLIDRGAIERIGRVFVETHADSIPSLVPKDVALREKIGRLGLQERIDLEWS